MRKVLLVARREYRDLTGQRWIIVAGVLITGWFSVMSALKLSKAAVADLSGEYNSSLFFLFVTMGIFVGYLFSGQAFLREKLDGVIETLMAAPVSLRALWLGKAIGVSLPAYLVMLAGAVVFTGVAQVVAPATVLPSLPVLIHVFVGVPTFILAAVGLLGFAQLLLGMRENHIVNLTVFFLLFFGIAFTQTVLPNPGGVSWTQLGVLLGFGVFLLALTGWLSKYLSRERIVRTIP